MNLRIITARRLFLAILLFGVVACSGDSSPTTTRFPPPPSTTGTSSLPVLTATPAPTSTAPPSTSTSPPPAPTTEAPAPELAWTEVEAERHVINYLAALAAGAYEQAAWSAENNGIESLVQAPGESFAQALGRLCAGGSCAGPYAVVAAGPGVLDLDSGQARSVVTVLHIATGEAVNFEVATFEGQLIIADVPPLVPSEPEPSMVESLFKGDVPDRVVVERFESFETWDGGATEWVTNWWADKTHDVEGEFIAARDRVAGLLDPEQTYLAECPRLMERDGEVLVLERCFSSSWRLSVAGSSEPRSAPIPNTTPGDGAFAWFDERGGTVLVGTGDAEGNLTRLETVGGLDLLGDDYAGLAALSVDGRWVAYVDHSDPAAYSHFWSPALVVKDVATGQELGRWVLDGPILSLEAAEEWVVAAETDPDSLGRIDIEQRALVAINVRTGTVGRVLTPERLYLPG